MQHFIMKRRLEVSIGYSQNNNSDRVQSFYWWFIWNGI